jgi:hypothetical protein
MATFKTIKVTVEFSLEACNELLEACNFTDKPPRRIEDFTAKELKEFSQTLKDTPFIEEIMYDSPACCANGWLDEWSPKDNNGETK